MLLTQVVHIDQPVYNISRPLNIARVILVFINCIIDVKWLGAVVIDELGLSGASKKVVVTDIKSVESEINMSALN